MNVPNTVINQNTLAINMIRVLCMDAVRRANQERVAEVAHERVAANRTGVGSTGKEST
jgi:pantoate kinase